LLPRTCVLQPELVHLYQASSLLPGHLPIVTSVVLRLLYWLLYNGHIKHFQFLGFLPFPITHVCVLPLACDPCPIILLHLFSYWKFVFAIISIDLCCEIQLWVFRRCIAFKHC
jgi:hypothetical protein